MSNLNAKRSDRPRDGMPVLAWRIVVSKMPVEGTCIWMTILIIVNVYYNEDSGETQVFILYIWGAKLNFKPSTGH